MRTVTIVLVLSAAGLIPSIGASAQEIPQPPQESQIPAPDRYLPGAAFPPTANLAAVVAAVPAQTPVPDEARDAFGRVQPEIIEQHPELFTGAWVANPGRDQNDCQRPMATVGVRSTVDADAAASMLTARSFKITSSCEPDGIRIIVDSTRITLATLQTISPLDFPGGVFASIDPERALVIVGTTALTTELRRETLTRHGRRVVLMAMERPAEATASRDADTSPFYAGARMHFANAQWTSIGGWCTLGLPWRLNGQPRWITAGHCYPTNGANNNAVTAATGGTGINATYRAGSMTGSTWGGCNTGFTGSDGDTAVVDPGTVGRSTLGRIYMGGVSTSVSEPLNSVWQNPTVGAVLRTGGATTGGIGGYTVQATGSQYTASNLCGGTVVRQQIHMTRSYSDGRCVEGGDSGGPVFQTNGTSSTLYGVISGSAVSGGTCNVWFTRAYQVNQRWGGNVAPSS